MAKKITVEDLQVEKTKLKRMLTLTANKLHETLNAMQPHVADSKDEKFIQAYELGRNHIRRNFNLGTELKKKTKKGKKLSEDDMFFESLPCAAEKTPALFQMMRETYKAWHSGCMGVAPLWEGHQFASLKKLERYFLKIAITRGKKHQEDTGEVLTQEMVKNAANGSWNALLAGLLTDKVDDFIRKQKKISQIVFNLTNIIDQLKNGTGRKQPSAKEARRNSLDQAEQESALASGVDVPHS